MTGRAPSRAGTDARDSKHSMPNDMQAGMYSATQHLIKAIAAGADPADGRGVVTAMKRMPTDDVIYGKGRIREDGRKLHDVLLFTTKTPQESKGEWDFLQDPLHHPAREGVPLHLRRRPAPMVKS